MAVYANHPEEAECLVRGVQFPGLCISCHEPAFLAVSCWGNGEPSPANGGAMHVRTFAMAREEQEREQFEEVTPIERWARG